MYKWSWLPALLIGGNLSWADCTLPARVIEHFPQPIESQRLLLPGRAKLQFELGQGTRTFAHVGDMLLVKYEDGALLSHRILDPDELRAADSHLPLPDFVRLMFGPPIETPESADLTDAKAHQDAIRIGCVSIEHYPLEGVDIYSYVQSRSDNTRYQAMFILDGGDVHFVDIQGSETLAKRVVSTLSKRS